MKPLEELAREGSEKDIRTIAGILTALQTAVREREDWLDLMCDEFQRISSCPGATAEIIGLCERARTNTKQRVPVIEQRDKAAAQLTQLKAELAETRKDGERMDWLERHSDKLFAGRLYVAETESLRAAIDAARQAEGEK